MFARKILGQTCLALVMGLGLGACQESEEAPTPPAEAPVQSVTAQSNDPSAPASGAALEMPSAMMEPQDTTAALTEAANAAVSMAADTGKK